jgi:hypothetical protein
MLLLHISRAFGLRTRSRRFHLSACISRGMSSPASPTNAQVPRQLQESLALQAPKYPKEFQCTADSLAQFGFKPDHIKWGFVVVRCVYGPASESPWAMMLELLRTSIAESLRLNNQIELLPHHEMTVIEDEATLTGADSYAARRAFRAWVAADLPPRLRDDRLEAYGGLTQVRAKLISNDAHWERMHPAGVAPPRWVYCIFIDQDCLRSLENGPEDPELQDPALKILTTDWKWDRGNVPTEEFTVDWDGGETDNDHEDVGWMYMDMTDYGVVYNRLTRFGSEWDHFYERPYKGYVDVVRS